METNDKNRKTRIVKNSISFPYFETKHENDVKKFRERINNSQFVF